MYYIIAGSAADAAGCTVVPGAFSMGGRNAPEACRSEGLVVSGPQGPPLPSASRPIGVRGAVTAMALPCGSSPGAMGSARTLIPPSLALGFASTYCLAQGSKEVSLPRDLGSLFFASYLSFIASGSARFTLRCNQRRGTFVPALAL